jgi:hypothetical protein
MNALAAGANLNFPLMLQQAQFAAQHAQQHQQPVARQAANPDGSANKQHPISMNAPLAQTTGPQQTTSTNSTAAQLSPFALFDAPVELRANFLQCQREHGLPLPNDPNSYHFGVAVNGFHPQNLPQQAVADTRHSDPGGKQIRNVKEQKRAQKITDLIDDLRTRMEKGGWKVGLKSKFNTLSSYVPLLYCQLSIEKTALFNNCTHSCYIQFLFQLRRLCSSPCQDYEGKGRSNQEGQV